MPAPGVDINLFDLTVYAPQITTAIVGCVGPATKGPINRITEFTDEGNFVTTHGRPPNANYFAQRAGVRYLKRGNQFKFVRVAGSNLASATLTLYAADGLTPILTLTASSPGTWANTDLKVAVSHNGTQSYNIFVYFRGQLTSAETFLALTNGIVVSKINNTSTRVTVALVPGAGATFPASTVNPVTGTLDRLALAGGDDGALATTDSAASTTSGVAGRRFYGRMDSVAGSRVFENILSIAGALAGKTTIRGTVGMPVVPGTFTIRVQTAAGPTYVELADNGNLSYAPGGGGVGILAPSAGAHTGFIDYRTGSWGVSLAGGSMTFAGGTVDGVWVRASAESVGAAAAGTGSYAGALSSGPLGVGFFSANKVAITIPVSEVVGSPAVLATHANTTALLKTLAGWIVPGSVVFTVTHPTDPVPGPVYDDGFGGVRTGPDGTGTALTGAVNYRTGTWSVTWDPTGPAFPAGGTILATYAIQVIDMGGGAVPGPTGVFATETVQPSDAGGDAMASSADPGAVPTLVPILRGTGVIRISATSGGPQTFYSDGADAGGVEGWLTRPRGDPGAVAVVGTLDRNTGAWSITLPAGTITAAAVITISYVRTAGDKARRALRGSGPQTIGVSGAAFTAGLTLADPAAGNSFNGPNWLDHTTGAFAISLALTPLGAGTQSFDVEDGAAITAVYAPAVGILGFGDGSEVTFAGTLDAAPFRRQSNRLQGFQGAQGSVAGAGEPQVTYSTLGVTADDDVWSQNVAASTDPDNYIDHRTGAASIKWTGAPLLDEAVFVLAEEVVLHVACKWPGDIGNERTPLTDGFYVEVGPDATLAGSIKLEVFFDAVSQESFGQALTVQELIDKVNDPTNGSQLVTAVGTEATGFLPADATAVQQCGLAGAFTTADVVGAKVGQVYTGLQLFQNDETVAVNWLMAPGQWHRQVINALQELCERPGRRALGIIPIPDLDDPFKHRDFYNGAFNAASPGGPPVPTVLVPYPPTVSIDSRQMAPIAPWVAYLDGYTNTEPFEPPDGELASLVAAAPQPWYPVAGYRRGKLNVTQLRYSASRDDRALTYGAVGSVTEIVNPIVAKFGRGPALFGQRTAQRAPSALDRINVSWTVNVIMNLLELVSQDFLFEINDAFLWREATQALNRVLKPVVEQRGLTDAYVICDGNTNTGDVIDRLEMRAQIFIKPARAVEYIVYDLFITPTDIEFSEVISPG